MSESASLRPYHDSQALTTRYFSRIVIQGNDIDKVSQSAASIHGSSRHACTARSSAHSTRSCQVPASSRTRTSESSLTVSLDCLGVQDQLDALPTCATS